MNRLTFLLLLLPLGMYSQSIDSSASSADLYFKEARKISVKDNGRLWGHQLYGRMIFVDQYTGRAIANEQDSAGTFTQVGNVFTGNVPKSFGSNTARYWGGKMWTVILWPLPKGTQDRAYLMMHELFHQLQKRNGLPEYDPTCSHLEKFEGRLLLKLELEALRKVINSYPAFSREDLQNAIAIRKYRYEKFPEADSLEHALELNEGLATFTGFILSGRNVDQSKKEINKQIDEFYRNETFTRSLGYVTGYIYGFLLSQKDNTWSRLLSAEVLSNPGITYSSLKEKGSFDYLVQKLYNVPTAYSPKETYDAVVLSGKYNFSQLYEFEKAREDKWIAIENENKRKFILGPVLELPNENMQFNFNPNEVQVLEEYGPVYPTFAANAAWGLLEVKNGGALVKDWMKVLVPLPENFDSNKRPVIGEGWQLNLKEGWTLSEGNRKGDFKVVKQ